MDETSWFQSNFSFISKSCILFWIVLICFRPKLVFQSELSIQRILTIVITETVDFCEALFRHKTEKEDENAQKHNPIQSQALPQLDF